MHGDGHRSASPVNTGHTTLAQFTAPLTKKSLKAASEFNHFPRVYRISCLIFHPGLVHIKIVHAHAFH